MALGSLAGLSAVTVPGSSGWRLIVRLLLVL